MKQESITHHVDVKAFAQANSTLVGHDLLSKYERLMKETQGLGGDHTLNWSAQGELRGEQASAEQVWLHLTVDASLPLSCQRCMSPVDITVSVKRSFRFVDSEEAAEAQDAQAEEDLLVLSQDFCLADLIEDEVLMGLPVVPRHEECPVAVELMVADPGFAVALAEKRNPFAALGKLQAGKTS